MGDAVDGIPGAPGIGEKGAVGLLETYGNVENAMAHWEEVKRKAYKEALRDHAETIRLSKQLATIENNAPVELNLEALVLEPPDAAAAYALFSELEFAGLKIHRRSAKRRCRRGGDSAAKAATRYTAIEGVAGLRKFVQVLYNSDRFAFALDATKENTLSGLAFSLAAQTADYFDFANCDNQDEAVELLREAFDNGLLEKVTHDAKRALHLLMLLGIKVEALNDDTLLQAYLLDAERAKYEVLELARSYMSSTLEPVANNLLAQTADLTLQLADLLNPRLREMKLEKVYREIELPLVPLLYDIERAGFLVDTNVLADLSVVMDKGRS